MNVYTTLLFLHVLGGVGVYVALGVEALALARFQRAETRADAGLWLRVMLLPRWGAPLSMLLALGSGMWMAVLVWGHRAWISGAFVALIAMAILGGAVTGRSLRRLRAALPAIEGAALPEPFRSAAASPALGASLRLRIALGVGVLALMSLKPGATGAAVTLAVSTLAGLIACAPLTARRPGLAGTGA